MQAAVLFRIPEMVQPLVRKPRVNIRPVCVGEDPSESSFMGLARAVEGGVGTVGEGRQRAFGSHGWHVKCRRTDNSRSKGYCRQIISSFMRSIGVRSCVEVDGRLGLTQSRVSQFCTRVLQVCPGLCDTVVLARFYYTAQQMCLWTKSPNREVDRICGSRLDG